MENQEQTTPTSIFSALGLENRTPAPVEISGEPTPSFEPTATPDGGEPAMTPPSRHLT